MGPEQETRQARAATVLLCATAALAAAADAWPCDALADAATTWAAPSVWWESSVSFFAQLRAQDGPLHLRGVLRLYPLAHRGVERGDCRAEGAAPVMQVCVSLVDTTAYTSEGAAETVAWVTLHTDPLLPVAIVEVDAACWERERYSLSRCRPCVLAPPQLQQLPLFRHSPLSRPFWEALRADALPRHRDSVAAARRPWLHRINVQASANRTVRAEWVRLAQLPALRGLELTGNAWATGAPQLPPLPELGELRLHCNGLTALPDDFLTRTPELEMLILAQNALTRLPSSIMNLKMLQLLDVTNPLHMGQSFSVDYISQLPKLRILGLENQKIVGNVMPILFMPSLMFLNMSGCGLTHVNNASNSPLATDLQVLDLSYNQLEVLRNGVLLKLPNLIRLFLQGNSLRILGYENEELELFLKLNYLDISQNRLKNLPLFHHNSQLKTLLAHDNVLEDFSQNFWKSLQFLEILDLSLNHLTEVPELKHQEHLKNLDLSNNEIKMLHSLSFGSMKNLTSVNLSNNLLTTLDPNVLKIFEQLKSIDLSHNRLWHVALVSNTLGFADLSYNLLTYMPLLNTPSMHRLSLKHNLISSVNFTYVNATNLRNLDLSWNKIRVANLGNLTFDVVDLSHNVLKEMPSDSFHTLTIKVEGNILNGTEKEEETKSDMWNSWYIWTLSGIGILAVITAVLLVGLALLVRKLMKRNEPLVLSSTCRSQSSVSFNETPALMFN